MADNNVKKPGLLQRLAVASPLLAGVGVGTRRLLKSTQFSNAFGGIQSHQNNYLKAFAAQINSQGIEHFTSDISIMNKVKNPEIIRFAWEMALESADPGKVLSRHPLDISDPGKDIKFFAEHDKSLQGKKVLQSFVKQLSVLETHQASVGLDFSAAMFGRAQRHNFIRSNMPVATIEDNILRETLTNIQEQIRGIPGVETNLQIARREGMDGAQLMFHMSGGRFGKGVALEIPMELKYNPGVIVHGVTQQTKRIVGRYGITEGTLIKSTLKHEQITAMRFAHEILPQLTKDNLTVAQARKLVTKFNYRMIEDSQVIPNIPRGLLRTHDIAEKLGGDRVVLLDKSFNRLKPEFTGQILANKANKVFASTSPTQLAKGVVSNFNGQSLWLAGEGYGWERRPMQAVGRGFGPSAKSLVARATSKTRQNFGWMRTQAYMDLFQGTEADIMANVAYVSEKAYPKFADKVLGGTLGGSGVFSTILNDQLENIAPLSLNIDASRPVNKKILDISKNATFGMPNDLQLRTGEVLGFDINGHPITYEEGMKIAGGFHYTSTDDPFIRLHGTQTLADEQFAKYFGGGKFVAQKMGQSELENMIFSETGRKVTGAAVVLGMDELRKNRGLHSMQMISAAYHFANQTVKGKGKSLKFSVFSDSLQDMLKKSIAGEAYRPDEITKGIYNIARQAALSPHAVGRIFGAVPDVYGDDWQEKFTKLGMTFRPDELYEINKRVSTGVSSFFYGGPGFTGGSGSVEPRMFELLQGSQYGKFGPRMAKDIADRMILANPEIVKEQSMLVGALRSIVHGAKSTEGLAEWHLKNMKNKDISDVLERGGIVHTDGVFNNLTSIRVPGKAGIDSSRSMRGHTLAEGEETWSNLAHAYEDMLETGVKIGLGKTTRSTGDATVQHLVAELGKAHADTMTGKGMGLARRKAVGSRYLKIIPGTEEELGDIYTQGISKKHGLNMFREMEELHRGNDQELAGLKKMKERFLAGESIAAVGHRDPLIGAYSTQYTKLKMIPRLRDTDAILIPQKTQILNDQTGKEIGRVSIGSMAGYAGDYDGDNAHIMLLSSTLEKDLMGHFSAGATKELHTYEDYIIRQQLLKAKAPKVELLNSYEEMGAAARKLALAKAQVGPLSVPLREMRVGLIEHGNMDLQSTRGMNAISLLEALEQVPISGKHASAEEIGNLEKQMTDIAAAARAGRGGQLASITKDIFKHNETAMKLLNNQDVEVVTNGVKRTIKGFDLAQTAEDLAKAISDLSSESRGMTENVVRSLMKGVRNLTKQHIDSYLEHSGGILSAFKLGAHEGAMSNIAEKAASIGNRIAAMGGDVIGHLGKPLAIGFGAALAISAALSRPLSSLDPNESRTPINSGRINTPNKRSVAPENIHPDDTITGEPQTPPSMTGPSLRPTYDDSAARIFIRGINRSGTNMSSVSNAITQRLQGNTNVNVNIRDRKTSLSQQKIDSIYRR